MGGAAVVRLVPRGFVLVVLIIAEQSTEMLLPPFFLRAGRLRRPPGGSTRVAPALQFRHHGLQLQLQAAFPARQAVDRAVGGAGAEGEAPEKIDTDLFVRIDAIGFRHLAQRPRRLAAEGFDQ